MGLNIRKKVHTKLVNEAKKRPQKPVLKDSDKANPFNKRVPKTARGRRVQRKRDPQVQEFAKNALMIRGHKAKANVMAMMKDLHALKAPLSKSYMRKHADLHPFEDHEQIAEMCKKEDGALFALGSSSKKRPFRLVLGRTFNYELLDMFEFDVQDFVPMADVSRGTEKPVLGAKPMLMFQGAAFDEEGKLGAAKSMLMDFFKGPVVEKVMLQHLESVIVFSCNDEDSENPKILFRQYKVQMLKSGSKLPYCQLKEVGPRFSLTKDREHLADPQVMKAAMRLPPEQFKKTTKNVDTTATGKKRGRIHLGRQDFAKIHTPHLGFEAQHAKKTKRKEETMALKKKTGMEKKLNAEVRKAE